MIIISKRQADKILVDSLFQGPKTLTVGKWDNGKYAESGIGKEIDISRFSDNIIAIYSQRKRDKDGPYYALMCLSN